MPADSLDRLSVVVFSGAFDRVHYALAMAAAALATGRPATLFFTMGATKALLAADPEGPGWRHLARGENGLAPLDADAALAAKGLAEFDDLLDSAVALGAKVMVCEMGLAAVDLKLKQLRGDIPLTAGGLVTFLAEASRHGALVFV